MDGGLGVSTTHSVPSDRLTHCSLALLIIYPNKSPDYFVFAALAIEA